MLSAFKRPFSSIKTQFGNLFTASLTVKSGAIFILPYTVRKFNWRCYMLSSIWLKFSTIPSTWLNFSLYRDCLSVISHIWRTPPNFYFPNRVLGKQSKESSSTYFLTLLRNFMESSPRSEIFYNKCKKCFFPLPNNFNDKVKFIPFDMTMAK